MHHDAGVPSMAANRTSAIAAACGAAHEDVLALVDELITLAGQDEVVAFEAPADEDSGSVIGSAVVITLTDYATELITQQLSATRGL